MAAVRRATRSAAERGTAVSLGAYNRRIAAGAVAGLTAAAVVLSSAPALADQVRNHEWWLKALHVPTVWHSSRGGGVTVAVLDTGVDPAQADLAGTVITGPDYTNSGRLPGGPYWGKHGTAMASLIAGRGHGPNNANGVVGVAPAAKILSVRVTLETGDPLYKDPNIAAGLPGAIAHGIRYAVNHGASVIDLPLDPAPTPGTPGAGGSKAERSAIAYALHKNVVLVAPAGDGGAGSDPVNFPAAYPGVIAVGAFDTAFTKGAFSSHQPYVTVTAAGVGMVAATTPKGYIRISSTSAASAVAAGILALVKAEYPGLTPAQVTKVLSQSTVYRPAGSRRVPGSGYGTMDAGLALLAAARIGKPAAPPPSPAASQSSPASAPAKVPASKPSPAASSHSSMLMMAVILAAVLLAGLLLLTLAFVQVRRRRARAARLAPIRLAAQMQPRRKSLPAGGSGTGEQAAVPAAAFAGPGGRHGTGNLDDRWGGSPWPPAALPGEADVTGQVPDWNGAGTLLAGAGGVAPSTPGSALVPAGPAAGRALPQRPGTRAPRIAGSPPWEPAAKPESELPWTTTAPKRPVTAGTPAAPVPLPQRRTQPPAKSPWDEMAEEAWPGGPAAGQPRSAPAPGAGLSGGGMTGTGAPGTPGGAGPAGLAAALPAGSGTWAAGTAGGSGLRGSAGSLAAGLSGSTGSQAAGLSGSTAAGPAIGAAGPAAGLTGSAAGPAAPSGGTAGMAAAGNGAGTGGPDDDAPWSTPGSGMLSAGLPAPAYEPSGTGRVSWAPDEDDEPLYSWNPGDVTESFPAYSPDED